MELLVWRVAVMACFMLERGRYEILLRQQRVHTAGASLHHRIESRLRVKQSS